MGQRVFRCREEGLDTDIEREAGMFDEQGVLHFLATRNGCRAWVNPHLAGDVEVAWSSADHSSQPSNLVSGNALPFQSYTKNEPCSWMRLDIGEHRSLAVDNYCLRNDGDAWHDFPALRNWELQGADAVEGPWETLRRHENDASLAKKMHAAALWPVGGSSAPAPAPGHASGHRCSGPSGFIPRKAFRFFRAHSLAPLVVARAYRRLEQ